MNIEKLEFCAYKDYFRTRIVWACLSLRVDGFNENILSRILATLVKILLALTNTY